MREIRFRLLNDIPGRLHAVVAAVSTAGLLSLILSSAVVMTAPALADGGVYSSTRHGDPNNGVLHDGALPRGNCAQCHTEHGSTTGMNDFGLIAPNYGGNKNGLCFISGCHADPSTSGVYQGQSLYGTSIHNLSSQCYWPGPNPPARPSSDSGNCANCHNPHGYADGAGLIPAMAVAREEALCTTCHDSSGPAMKDIGSELTRAYDHYIDNPSYAGRHSANETMTASNYSGTKRHVECPDCHNVHRIPSTTTHTIGTNAASDALMGVSWVQVNGDTWPTGGSTPSFTPHPANDVQTIRYEYELCLKCHSNWAYGFTPPLSPSGGAETDQSVEFNPNNLSYHPVVSAVKSNSYTRPTSVNGFKETMTGAWANGSSEHFTMYCSDCHADSASGTPNGPHGSNTQYLLIAPTSISDNTLCLKCHSQDVYAPLNQPSGETGSRFDQQTTGNGAASHYYHVVSRGIGCRACHGGRQSAGVGPLEPGSIHGTNKFPGFMNGTNIAAYSPGSCTPESGNGFSCHGNESYTAGPE